MKEDTPHLYFLEPISSLLVKTWTLVEIKTASKVCQQSEAQSWFLSPLWRVCSAAIQDMEEWQEGQGTAAAIWTLSLPQSWKAAPAAGPSLGGKQAESCSSFSSQDQSSEGFITSSAADTSIPARLHRQLQLPQAAHPPQSPAGPEKQNLSRKLGQRWVLPHYRPIPTEFLFSLHFAYLQQGREQLCRCLQKWKKRAKQTFWFFDIRLWFRFSDELSQVTDSSKRHPPEERSEEPHGWSKELWHCGKMYLAIYWLHFGIKEEQ